MFSYHQKSGGAAPEYLARLESVSVSSLTDAGENPNSSCGLQTTKWSKIIHVEAERTFVVSCRECGQRVRYEAEGCPRCGAPWPGLTRALALIYGMALLAFGLATVLIILVVH
jgi:hypothetical protein